MNNQRLGLRNDQIDSEEQPVSEDELKLARRLFTSLLLTVKNLSLYPHGHTICVNSIKQFHTQLAGFLNKYETLKIEIEREQIFYKGKIISTEMPVEGTLHYTLFRDGVSWIEFIDGIEEKEINEILLIMNKYARLSTEPEGDIVTALWEIPFSNVRYEVAEFFWDNETETERFSDLATEKPALDQIDETELRETEYQSDNEIELDAIKLTPEEETELQKMISVEEVADITSYLDALLDSLMQNREEVIFDKILDALFDEFSLSLSRKDFIITIKILQGVKYVLDIYREELPWAGTLLEGFLNKVSSSESLITLKDTWSQTTPEDAVVLRDIFLLLNPKVIQVLIPILSQSQPAYLKNMLLDLITLIASQDTPSLELALNNANVNLLERLVSVIVKMDSGHSMKYLLKLSRHTSAHVRYEAIKGILNLEPARIKDMLDLIDDKDDSIRQLVIEQMGQSRNDTVEGFLISYIKKNKSGRIDAESLTQCLRILGKCGSSRSVPFLGETLLKWGFLSGYKRSILRKGAAIALVMLDIPQADEVLGRASRSLFPGVRRVINETRQELNKEAGGSVE